MRKKITNHEIFPEEIFSDALNIPGFNEDQFEGRIERPISHYVLASLGIFFLLVGIAFTYRVLMLQIVRGEKYSVLSERNHLRNVPIFAKRGVIYDRNKKELAWNTESNTDRFSDRAYAKTDGLGHVLGYLSMPKRDQSGNFWQTESEGKDGIEKKYDTLLKGENGMEIIETNASGEIVSGSVAFMPKQGENINLSVDSRVSEKMYQAIADLSQSVGFTGGAGIIMDARTGEILTLTSYPEYSSGKLSEGDDTATINSYIKDKRMPFLNRAVSGLYTPGSTVKPFVALGALSENIIDPLKQILSTGSISIPNQYDPSKPTVFKDWKAHGWTDMRHAIAVSSDVYFYTIGGGFEGQRGMGIANIEKYARMFGLGENTGIDLPLEAIGIIPNPEWKAKNFNGEKWLVGNTYHTAIGQYGFQITPLQLVRAIAAIANGGTLVTPHLRDDPGILPAGKIQIDPSYFQIVREGMRLSATEGTGTGLNIPGISIATKTGTAELGVSKNYVNSWVTGFFPYENPKYAFVVVMEKGPRTNTLGGVYVMRQVLEWMQTNTPEYLHPVK